MTPSVNVNLGIHDEGRKSVAHKLTVLLADTYLLYLKTQNFHWNVTGRQFHSLHEMFEEQYIELAGAVDAIAERIRMLGLPAPGSFKEFLANATLSEANGVPSAEEMVQQLLNDHETISRQIRDMVASLADNDDEASVGLVTERLAIHEKTAWMLRSSL